MKKNPNKLESDGLKVGGAMPRCKRKDVSNLEIMNAYCATGSLHGMAEQLGITYPTAIKWAKEIGITLKAPGYTRPVFPVTGAQCRHAREYLKLTRDEFCKESKVSKTALREFELGKSTPRDDTYGRIILLFNWYKIKFKEDGTFECAIHVDR